MNSNAATQADLDELTCADGVHSIVAPDTPLLGDTLPDGVYKCLDCRQYLALEAGEVVEVYQDKRPADVRARGKGRRVWPLTF